MKVTVRILMKILPKLRILPFIYTRLLQSQRRIEVLHGEKKKGDAPCPAQRVSTRDRKNKEMQRALGSRAFWCMKNNGFAPHELNPILQMGKNPTRESRVHWFFLGLWLVYFLDSYCAKFQREWVFSRLTNQVETFVCHRQNRPVSFGRSHVQTLSGGVLLWRITLAVQWTVQKYSCLHLVENRMKRAFKTKTAVTLIFEIEDFEITKVKKEESF